MEDDLKYIFFASIDDRELPVLQWDGDDDEDEEDEALYFDYDDFEDEEES